MIIHWPAPAKLNLFLYITGRRADGYHELQTLFQFLDYSDLLTFTATKIAEISLSPAIDGVANEQNLIIKAAKLLQNYCQIKQGAAITLQKVLPMGGGLGGGSSNAATTLIALNHLWQCGLSLDELAQQGLKLGADVPVFIHGNAAFAEGVGEQLHSVEIEEKWYLVVHPGIHVSTHAIFNDPELKRNSPKRSLHELLSLPFINDCEAVVKRRFEKVEQLTSNLLKYNQVRLTGTGACVFAEFPSKQAAVTALQNIPEWSTGFVAKGVNQSPLHRLLRNIK